MTSILKVVSRTALGAAAGAVFGLIGGLVIAQGAGLVVWGSLLWLGIGTCAVGGGAAVAALANSATSDRLPRSLEAVIAGAVSGVVAWILLGVTASVWQLVPTAVAALLAAATVAFLSSHHPASACRAPAST